MVKMPPNRRMRRALGVEGPVSVRDFFFRPGTDELRTDLVTRKDLFWALDWYHRSNRWYRVLWRWLRGSAVVAVRPLALLMAAGRARRGH